METIERIERKRWLSFLAAVLFYLTSFYFFSQQKTDTSLMYISLFDLLGLFALDRAVRYKEEEKELRIHSFIEKQIKTNIIAVYSKIAIILSGLTLVGIFNLIYNYFSLDNMSLKNKGLMILLHFLFFLSYSFWMRKEQLKKKRGVDS